MTSVSLTREWTARLSLVVLTASTFIALAVTLQIGRPRLVGASYFLIGATVTLGISHFLGETDTTPLRWLESYGLKLGSILAILSIPIVMFVGPGVVFYSLVGTVFVLGIVRTSHSPTIQAPILVGIASFLVMYSQVVPFEFTAITRDTVVHTLKITWLMEQGAISRDFMPRYIRTPIYHVLVSEYGIISGMDARTAAFVVTGVAFVFSLFPMLVTFRMLPLDRSERHLVVSLVLFSAVFIYHGYRVFPQSLTFVYMLLLMSIISSRGYQYSAGIVLFTLCMILTNTVGTILSLILLIVFLVTKGEWTIKKVLRVTVFGTMLAYYWVFTSIFDLLLFYFAKGSGAAKGVESTIYVIETQSQLIAALLSGIGFGLNLANLSVLAGFFASGAIYMLYSGRRRYLGFAAFCALFLFPNPAWFVLRGLALTSRWSLMILPFALIPVAVALYRGRIAATRVGLVLLFVLAFTSGSLAMSEPSLTDMAGYDKEKQHSISESEFATIEFVENNGQTQVNTRWIIFTYMDYVDSIENHNYRAEMLSVERIGGSLSHHEGLTVVPSRALEESAVRAKIEKPSEKKGVEFTDLVTKDDVTSGIKERNKVYANGANHILHA